MLRPRSSVLQRSHVGSLADTENMIGVIILAPIVLGLVLGLYMIGRGKHT